MTGFAFVGGRLTCDGLDVADIAAATGTPFFIYSAGRIRDAFNQLDDAFASYPHAIHYALKANSTLAIVRLVRHLGAHADANSLGEIDVALRAGFEPSEIVFTGVGKTRDELARAIGLGVRAINVESNGEAARIDALAQSKGVRARVAVRVNPDIDPQTHQHISTGVRASKFGVPIDHVPALLRELARRPGLEPVGLHVHLGSQIRDMVPIARAARVLADLAIDARDAGIRLEHLDLGGGLGISYDGSPAPSPATYAGAILPAVRDSGLHLLLEPGRVLVASAGALVGSVADIKAFSGAPSFLVLDTGMTELIRPMLYDAFHRIEAVVPRGGPEAVFDVVGPLCETSDTLGRDRTFGPVEVGDLVAVFDTGAYGIVMASNYNRRCMPPEVLVDNGGWRITRRRQTIEDMLRLEQ
ncbi:MAG: diaminopimelate decarboxylase [Acidobacteriota bacterium]